MQSVTEAPPQGTELPSAPAGLRRPRRRRLVVALALVAISLITAAGIFLTNYDPLCHGPCTGSAAVRGIDGVRVEHVGNLEAPDAYPFTAVRVHHRPDGLFRFLFTLSNQGPLGVTITRIGPGPETEIFGFPFVGVRLASIGGRERPFQPFSLAGRAREYVNVWVTVRMEGCLGRDAGSHLGTVPISYRVLGFTRHTTVYLPESIEVVGSPGETCS